MWFLFGKKSHDSILQILLSRGFREGVLCEGTLGITTIHRGNLMGDEDEGLQAQQHLNL